MTRRFPVGSMAARAASATRGVQAELRAPLTPEQKKAKRERQQQETERQARQFTVMCQQYGVPSFVREFEFREGRDSRFDFAWPAHRIALEVDGGIFAQHGHGNMVMFAKDLEKLNAASSAGWLVFRCAPGYKDITRHRKSTKTGLPTPTPIYSVPALCSFTTLKLIRDAIEDRRDRERSPLDPSPLED